jgi:ceramide glucosyltransferase
MDRHLSFALARSRAFRFRPYSGTLAGWHGNRLIRRQRRSAMFFAFLITVCSAFSAIVVFSLFAVTRASRRRHVSREHQPSVTILKPLCGADDDLESNLTTFFTQHYANYELLFGVEGDSDPAADVVRRLRVRFPQVPCRLVLHNGARGLNPKVSNLRAMLESGAHDIVLISDSNVAVSPDYLERMVGELIRPGVGMVTSPLAGWGEDTLGSVLENLQMNSQIAGVVSASSLAGRTLVVGKSVMFRRSLFERLGGFGSVANLLAEDYVMGRMFLQAGYRVSLCQNVVRNVSKRTSLAGFVRRYLRWSVMRARIKPLAYPLEPLGNPLAIALMAPLAGASFSAAILWALGLILLRDALCWIRLRGTRGLARALPLAPLKELIMLLIWAGAPFVRHISWRSHRVRISAGTRLYARHLMDDPVVSVHEQTPSA